MEINNSRKGYNIPIEIVNKILTYVAELNNEVVYIQYDTMTYKENYKINILSNLLWDIKSICFMKKIYPISNVTTKTNRELYKHGKEYYKRRLQEKYFLLLLSKKNL
jgi:hypothetical protein